MRIKFAVLFGIFLILAASGCGKLKPLGGKVTFSDGKPLTTGMVVFQTATFEARGALDQEGKYEVGSYNNGDGIPKGTYQVFISGASKYEMGDDKNVKGMKETLLIDPKFTSPEESGLKFIADGTVRTFDIVVEPFKK